MDQNRTVGSSLDVFNAIQSMRVDTQRQIKRAAMAMPSRGAALDVSSRRNRESVSSRLAIGSPNSCDISDAVISCIVVRTPTTNL